MKKILICGLPDAGKTYLAREAKEAALKKAAQEEADRLAAEEEARSPRAFRRRQQKELLKRQSKP